MTNTVNISRISRHFKTLSWAISIYEGCFFIILSLENVKSSSLLPDWLKVSLNIHDITTFLALVILTSGLAFLVSLAILVKQFGKSLIIWVGGSMLTGPIGPLLAWGEMRKLVKNLSNPSTNIDQK